MQAQAKSVLTKDAKAWVQNANEALRRQHAFCYEVAKRLDKRDSVIKTLQDEVSLLRQELTELVSASRKRKREEEEVSLLRQELTELVSASRKREEEEEEEEEEEDD